MRVWRGRAIPLVVTLLAAGCSSSGPANGVVRGRVMLDGNPLAGVTVSFTHPETKLGVNARTGTNGEYEIQSYRDRGLPPGKYLVAVRPRTELKSDEEAIQRTVERTKQANPWAVSPVATTVPTMYHNPTTSGLTIEVVSGGNPSFDFNLKPGG
jgi:Carboxypeptidase regulatory-like domain